MALDVELYRRIVYAPRGGSGAQAKQLRRISVIDIAPEGARRTLVFVHGFGGRALQWVNQLRSFGRDARVIAPDLRGHGQSDDPAALPMDMDALVEDLRLVLEKLGVEGPFTLLAHSFGGAVAIEYALRYPERVAQLVLIGVPSQFTIRPALRRLMNIPNPVFSRLRRWLNIALYASLPTLRRMHDQAMAPWRGDLRMSQARAPTLVILGHRDQIFMRERYEDASRLIPGAQSVVIPVSAHLVQLERPDAVNRAIRRFIEARSPLPATATSTVPAPRMRWRQYYDLDVPETVPIPRQPLETLLANAAREFPNRAALIFFGQRIGYRELDRLSNRFAHALRNHGLQPGDRVAIVLPNIPQCVIAFYGALKAGAVVVLGSPLSSEEAIAHQVSDSGARVLVTLNNYRAMCERIAASAGLTDIIYTDVREYLPVRRRLPLAGLAPDTVPPHPGEAVSRAARSPVRAHSFQRLLRGSPAAPLESGRGMNDLALIQYTSGTIEEPKGAMLTHGSLMVNVSQVRHWIPAARRGREVMLCVLPLSHIYGVTGCLNLSIALAGAMALLPTSRPGEVLQEIRRERPSLLPGVPSLYLMIANYPRVRSYGVASIRTCISGSAPLPVELQEAFEKLTRGRLVEGYGLTEASPVTHCNPLNGERRVGSIGIPLPGTNARIVNVASGEEVAPGEVGELLIQGPQVMRGYWNAPDDTAQALSDGWLRTGDLARMDEDGFFAIVERKKDMILAGPYNVYPREVEEVLYEHPKVLEAAVVGSTSAEPETAPSDGVTAPVIRAFVVLRNGERATAEEILAFCRERLDAYKAPRSIEFRSELPENFVGKTLRRLLVGPA
ncbi:MAG TPA: alpha/beta fold hydrolase [Ktedonobacterales bacterium]